jgi:ribonuclease inhibitor
MQALPYYMGMNKDMKITINGLEMVSKQQVHNLLARELQLPDYYGQNLDALWDVMITYRSPLTIQMNHTKQFIHNLDVYGDALIQLLTDLEASNNNIKIILYD